MRAALFFNPKAGSGASLEHLRAVLERHGHQVVRVCDDAGALAGFDQPPAELLVVAGGDGTVARVMRGVAGTRLPLAVLPMGTANNIARSVGADGSLELLVHGWHFRRARPFDFGSARGPWGERRFVEGLGGGLVSQGIAASEARPVDGKLPVPPKMAWALMRFKETLRAMKPEPWKLALDGADWSGDYLVVEVLNIQSIGPNLELAHSADPFDGLLTVVTAGEAHRAQLEAWLDGLAHGIEAPILLPCRNARRVELEATAELHLDDELHGTRAGAPVTIEVQPGVLQLWG